MIVLRGLGRGAYLGSVVLAGITRFAVPIVEPPVDPPVVDPPPPSRVVGSGGGGGISGIASKGRTTRGIPYKTKAGRDWESKELIAFQDEDDLEVARSIAEFLGQRW
jgi:hypothetical protein